MVTDYNQNLIAEQYQQAKAQPWRLRTETHSFLKLVGDVEGKRVLDVACGEGHFTRMLRSAGAAEVVGIDISERMIDLAREQETRRPLGIEYRVEDARAVAEHADFEPVVGAWLLV
jgi:toxoflavin synthase